MNYTFIEAVITGKVIAVSAKEVNVRQSINFFFLVL